MILQCEWEVILFMEDENGEMKLDLYHNLLRSEDEAMSCYRDVWGSLDDNRVHAEALLLHEGKEVLKKVKKGQL